MYSGAGLGYSVINESYKGTTESGSTSGLLNFQLNLAGIRVGKTVALKMEFGFGYKGVINGGLSIRPNSKNETKLSE